MFDELVETEKVQISFTKNLKVQTFLRGLLVYEYAVVSVYGRNVCLIK